MTFIDISQPLGQDTAVWPGDRRFTLEWTLSRRGGDAVDVAAVGLSTHTGTHIDGPRHVLDGPGAGQLALDPFIGPAAVVDGREFVVGDPPVVDAGLLDSVDPAATPRVLIRTRDAVDPFAFPLSFPAFAPALARRLAELDFVLAGTDAPSIDPVDSRTMESHRILARAGIPHVENLVLSGVAPGQYTYIGLPLRLTEADSSPTRAVLVSGAL